MRTWIIGSGAECDVVVARATVSGRHCRLTETGDGGYLLRDLGASNGTYVNGTRITAETRVTADDVITLGATVPMPWTMVAASPGARVVRIGRSADNDIVLDDPRISTHHARLIISGSQVLIEDLGSSNGTFVNTPDRKATNAIPLAETDIVSFGSLTVPAARLLNAQIPPVREVPFTPPVVDPEPAATQVVTHAGTSRRAIDFSLLALLAQSPIIAVVIVIASGRRPAEAITSDNWTIVGGAIADVAFALSLAAIWLGGTLAAWPAASGRLTARGDSSTATHPASLGANLLVLAALCVAQCFVLLLIVHAGSGLKGAWLAMLGILVLASAVGLSLGLFAFRAAPNRTWAAGALVLAFAVMVAAGGWIWPLAGANQVLQVSSALMPTRWAFEALLELEADARMQPSLPDGAQSAPSDMVEPFFTAQGERMGPEADSLALGAMLISLSSLAAFLFATSRRAISSVASSA